MKFLIIYPIGVYNVDMRLFLIMLTVSLFAIPALARPVSYPGGWTAMSMNDKDANSLHIHYSPNINYSVGWRHEYLRDVKAHADSLQINALLKRWNMPQAQANLYLKSGAGVAYESDRTEPVFYTGVATDWENRRFFTSYENRLFYGGDIDSSAKHKARLGVAPYIGEYGDLHTWLMLQADYDAGADDEFSVTPLIRFFKGPHLLEVGYNTDGAVLFNFVERF